MSTIKSTLAGGVHRISTTELAELDTPVKVQPLPVSGLELPGVFHLPASFVFALEKTVSVLRPNDAQKAELKESPALFAEFLQHAIDTNKAYFVREPKPDRNTQEYRRGAARFDAFNREAVALAKELYSGPAYAQSLDKIDEVAFRLAKDVINEITLSGHPTAVERMKLAVGGYNFAGYDEGAFFPGRGAFPGYSIPGQRMFVIAARNLDAKDGE